MRTRAVLLTAVLLVAAGGAGMAVGGVADGAATGTQTQVQGPEPGARLAGVVGSHNATIAGEVDRRAFEAAYDRAETDRARAGVIQRQAGTVADRLEALRERKRETTARHENGTLAEGAYRARTAALAARIGALSSLANETSDRADRLPEATLREHGVNTSRLDTLRRNAANLSGPAVAAIARGVAGGQPPRAGPPDDRTRGPPDGQSAGPSGTETAGPGDRADGNRTAGAGHNTTDGPPGQGTDGGQAAGERTGPAGAGGNTSQTADTAD
jgi:hypothetical protein